MSAESAELTRAVVGLLDLVHEYGPTVAGGVALWLAKRSAGHAKQASTDAKAARDSSASSASAAAHPITAPTPPAEPKPRNITDSGIIRIAGYLERRINEVDKRKAKHADEDSEAS